MTSMPQPVLSPLMGEGVGVRTNTMWPLVVRVGEAGSPQVSPFSRYLESVPYQGPGGRHVRETRQGCCGRGCRPSTGWEEARRGLLGVTGGICRDGGRERLRLEEESGVPITVIWAETGALGLHWDPALPSCLFFTGCCPGWTYKAYATGFWGLVIARGPGYPVSYLAHWLSSHLILRKAFVWGGLSVIPI